MIKVLSETIYCDKNDYPLEKVVVVLEMEPEVWESILNCYKNSKINTINVKVCENCKKQYIINEKCNDHWCENCFKIFTSKKRYG